MSTRRAGIVIFSLILASLASGRSRADYALRDGDTVVFLGDSITAARTFGKIVENYTLLRFPERRVRFINSGWGGDTAAGGLARLERDVFAQGATVLIVAYGVNDIGWGARADEEHRRIYLDAVGGIVDACRRRGVRVFLCSAAITAEDPDRAEGGFLEKMCDAGMALARERGEGAIDLQRSMRVIQRRVLEVSTHAASEKDKTSLHAADGIHLNDLGQLAMSLAILKGLGAPADVSSVTIDTRAGGPALVAAEGCRVTSLHADSGTIAFDRLDDGLPLNLGLFAALQFRFVPIPDELNRYMLAVTGLTDGRRYEVVVEGRSLGTFGSEQLRAGVNIASTTADGWEPGGPWDAQAWNLVHLTDARTEVAMALRFTEHYQPGHPHSDALRDQTRDVNARLEALQRTLVQPRTFHFFIRPAPTPVP